jgi:hypothetical protein
MGVVLFVSRWVFAGFSRGIYGEIRQKPGCQPCWLL